MELITQREAAAILNVSIRTITRYRQAGLLQTVKINNKTIRIPKLSVEKLLGESIWHKKHKSRAYKSTKADTTSTLETTTIASEYRQGQMIWLSQRHGFKAG
ncbi:MAG: hypothetical protein CL942_15840 [Desulfovibrio sp.]|nr:hypothetical protein [Desulfovibrio sp.]MBC18339.1 hypothetical protein [Desulfovibrio sp.]MBC18509.1 hypothetical protein [Desulfovibrio sp.]